MARIRTIKPEFWKHENLSELPEATHMLAAALLNHADDEGFFNANPGLVRAECSPLREPSVSIQESLSLLTEVGYIRLGDGEDGKRYGWIVTFDDHQRVNRPTPSKIRSLRIRWDDSVSTHGELTEGSSQERKGKEGNREGNREASESGDSEFALAPPAPTGTDAKPPAKTKPSAPKPEPLQLPDWLPTQSWIDWHDYRLKRTPKGWTAKAQELSVATLAKLRAEGHDPVKVIEASIENCWTGLFPLKTNNIRGSINGNQRHPGESLADYSARINRAHEGRG